MNDTEKLMYVTGLSVRNLADTLGIDYSNLDRMRRGKKHTPDNVKRDLLLIAEPAVRKLLDDVLAIKADLSTPE